MASLAYPWCVQDDLQKFTYIGDTHCVVMGSEIVASIGTTVNVLLVTGSLKAGCKIVLCGLQGPIVTDIIDLMTPAPMVCLLTPHF